MLLKPAPGPSTVPKLQGPTQEQPATRTATAQPGRSVRPHDFMLRPNQGSVKCSLRPSYPVLEHRIHHSAPTVPGTNSMPCPEAGKLLSSSSGVDGTTADDVSHGQISLKGILHKIPVKGLLGFT